jgi:hypothetical protein
MLTNDFLCSLPDDPDLGFIKLVDYLNEWLEQEYAKQNSDARTMYAEAIHAFVDEYDLDVPFRSFGRDGFESREDWDRFSSAVNYTKNRYQFRHRRGSRMLLASSVTLNAERRAEIHSLIAKIRKVVAVLDVSEDKRDRIYSRIAALAKEVDQSKTFYGTLMCLILETSGTLGEAAERLDPLARLIRRLTSIVADQKTADEELKLSAPPETKRIEGPAPPQRYQDLDDDIPF